MVDTSLWKGFVSHGGTLHGGRLTGHYYNWVGVHLPFVSIGFRQNPWKKKLRNSKNRTHKIGFVQDIQVVYRSKQVIIYATKLQ